MKPGRLKWYHWLKRFLQARDCFCQHVAGMIRSFIPLGEMFRDIIAVPSLHISYFIQLVDYFQYGFPAVRPGNDVGFGFFDRAAGFHPVPDDRRHAGPLVRAPGFECGHDVAFDRELHLSHIRHRAPRNQ